MNLKNNEDFDSEMVADEMKKLADMLEKGSVIDMGDDRYILDAKKEIAIRKQARLVRSLLLQNNIIQDE